MSIIAWSPGLDAAKGDGTPSIRSPAGAGWNLSRAIASSENAGRGDVAAAAMTAAPQSHFDSGRVRIPILTSRPGAAREAKPTHLLRFGRFAKGFLPLPLNRFNGAFTSK